MMYGYTMRHMMRPWFGFGFYGAYTWVAGIIALLFVAAIVLSIVAIVRTSKHRKSSSSAALEALDIRYAKGELSKDEYESIKKDLK